MKRKKPFDIADSSSSLRYLRCADTIRARIAEGVYPAGQFIPSERQLSQAFELNRLTVRRGLSELIREGILRSVPGAGNLVMERDRAAPKTRMIALMMMRNVGPPMLDPFYAGVFGGFEDEVSRRGYQLLVSSEPATELWPPRAQAKAAEIVAQNDIQAMAFMGGVSEELAMALYRKGVQILLLDQASPYPEVSSVVPDNLTGACEAVRHLLGLGHRRIAFLRPPWDPVARLRYEGLLKAHREAGCAFDERLIVEGDYVVQRSREAMTAFLGASRRLPFTALFAVNDEAALGAMKALKDRGFRIPQDVSVVGFDDVALAAQAEPPLSTVRVPRQDMGRFGARTLIQQLESPTASPARLVMQTEFIPRESSAAPTALSAK